jgi:predicted GNAT family acetyltransferase
MKQQHQAPAPAAEFRHDEARSRYELVADDRVLGFAQYRREGEVVVFTHTEIDDARQGQGLGSRLASHALDDVRRRGLRADPRCSFIARYIQRHEKEYGELVAR